MDTTLRSMLANDRHPDRVGMSHTSQALLMLSRIRGHLQRGEREAARNEAQTLAVWLAHHGWYQVADHALCASLAIHRRDDEGAAALLDQVTLAPDGDLSE